MMVQRMNRWYVGYQQKRRYQGSYVRACVIVYLMCAGVVVLGTGQKHAPPPEVTRGLPEARMVETSGEPAGSEVREVYRVRWRSRGEAESRQGYLGAIRIVRSSEATGPTPTRSDGQEWLAGPMLQPVALEVTERDGAGYGTGAGGWWGDGQDPFGLGPSSPYLPPASREIPWEPAQEEIGRTRDAWVELVPPKWPFLASGFLNAPDSGVVYVWLLIRADGTIRYKMLSESPAGFGFGHSVEQALLRGRYHPPEQNGQKDSVSLILRVLLCPGCESYIASQPAHVKGTLLK